MDKEQLTLLGFEIVAYAGDARSKFLEALDAAKNGEYDKAEQLIACGDECLNKAHSVQTDLLSKEAAVKNIEFSVTLMHGQDHLMTAILLRDLMKHIIALYKKG